MKDEKIDLVYTWVDDTDKVWLEKRKKYVSNYILEKESNDNCRFSNYDELKYSLRSVEKYAPWINHIFIVTAGQVPNWLDFNNPKISIVDHSEIMPEDALPTFNSLAIENCICNIPNLSEYFIYANDDTFFVRNCNKDFFYDLDGYPICRFNYGRKHPENTQYNQLIQNAYKMIKEKFNVDFKLYPHHCIDAYRKSDFIEFQKEFEKEVKNVVYSRFRTSENFERIAYLIYACVIKHGRLKLIKKVDVDLPFLRRIYKYLTHSWERESLYISNTSLSIEDELKKFNPTLICINDTELSNNSNREASRDILDKLFSDKSSFELGDSDAES